MKKYLSIVLVGAMTASLLAGCGASSDGASEEAETSAEGVKVVTALVANDWQDYAILNDAGELEGYEVDVLKAVDELAEGVEIKIEGIATDEMTPMLTQVAEGRADMAVCEFEYNDERAETYLFAEEGYNDFSTYIMTLKGSGYTTLESLAGKTMGNNAESDPAVAAIQDYNEANPDKAIEMVYYGDVGADVAVQGLKEGKWDAMFSSRDNLYIRKEQFGDIFDVGDVIYASEAYFLYTKDAGLEDAQKAIDEALRTLKENGELNEIHNKWFGFPAFE